MEVRTCHVKRRTTFTFLGEQESRVYAELQWEDKSPFEVLLVFPSYGGLMWSFAVDLLVDGLRGPAGLGDVSILPDLVSSQFVELVLSAPGGRVGFRVPRRVIRDFLAKVGARDTRVVVA